jgi:hypothetical protein
MNLKGGSRDVPQGTTPTFVSSSLTEKLPETPGTMTGNPAERL